MVLAKKFMGKKKVMRRGRPLRRVPRPLKMNAKRVGGPNTCRVSETLPLQQILPNVGYRVLVGGITGARAQAIAPQFALYRIARIVLKFQPASDTYVSNPGFIGGNGAITVPNLLWKMNRFADAPAVITGDDLRTMGAKPIRFDDKNLTISYKPNILVSNASGGSVSGEVKISPWLNTDSAPDNAAFVLSTTQHYGHFHLVECAVNGAGTEPVGNFQATIYYEFKNPRVQWGSHSSVSGKPVVQFDGSKLESDSLQSSGATGPA